MSKIYWFIGQPNSGKTTIAKRLQYWLQTDKKNWRKSVFHIDESDIKLIYSVEGGELERKALDLAKFLSDTNHDVVISTQNPSMELREQFKKELHFREVYCYCKTRPIPKDSLLLDFEKPISGAIELDTSNTLEETFKFLLKIIV